MTPVKEPSPTEVDPESPSQPDSAGTGSQVPSTAPAEVAPTIPEPPTQDPANGQSQPAAVPAAAAPSRTHPSPAQHQSPAAKRFKAEPVSGNRVWGEYFDVVPNEGRGDCAYIAVACGIHLLKKRGKPIQEHERAPGGNLQAALRLLTAGELRKNRAKYGVRPADAEAFEQQVGQSGNPITSPAMRALSEATKTQIMIWAWEINRWSLYMPAPATAKKCKQRVWVVLRDQHYELLRPNESLTDDKIQEWVEYGLAYPEYPNARVKDILQGGAQKLTARNLAKLQRLSPSSARAPTFSEPASGSTAQRRARSLLGLSASGTETATSHRRAPSTASGARAAARALLGIPSSSTSRVKRPRSPSAASTKQPKKQSAVVTVSPTRRARSLLGLSAVSTSASSASPGPVGTEAHLQCPCGWAPSAASASGRRVEAIRHWRNCQGTPPPKAGEAGRSASGVATAHLRRGAKRAAAFRNYIQWRDHFPSRSPRCLVPAVGRLFVLPSQPLLHRHEVDVPAVWQVRPPPAK